MSNQNNATTVRKFISDAFDAENYKNIILTPSILIGLTLILHKINCRKISITNKEYYGKEHFYGFDVNEFEISDYIREIEINRPDAIIMSIVTWQGEENKLHNIFESIILFCKENKIKQPLLICDYSHAGAIGFPSISDINADIFVGDLHKWVLDLDGYCNIGFIYIKNENILKHIKNIFSVFFMALEEDNIEYRKSRWIEPEVLKITVQNILKFKKKNCSINEEHTSNLKLKNKFLEKIGMKSKYPNCAIYWIEKPSSEIKKTIYSENLDNIKIWETGSGIRLIFRCNQKSNKRASRNRSLNSKDGDPSLYIYNKMAA